MPYTGDDYEGNVPPQDWEETKRKMRERENNRELQAAILDPSPQELKRRQEHIEGAAAFVSQLREQHLGYDTENQIIVRLRDEIIEHRRRQIQSAMQEKDRIQEDANTRIKQLDNYMDRTRAAIQALLEGTTLPSKGIRAEDKDYDGV